MLHYHDVLICNDDLVHETLAMKQQKLTRRAVGIMLSEEWFESNDVFVSPETPLWTRVPQVGAHGSKVGAHMSNGCLTCRHAVNIPQNTHIQKL